MMNASVSLAGEMYEVKVLNWDRDDIEAIKIITGRRWNDKRKVWRIPITPLSSMELRESMNARSWTRTAQVDARVAKESDSASELSSLSSGDDAELPEALPIVKALRPFQRAGVKFGIKAKRVLIADEMGLGKSLQAIAITELTNSYPALVVCPASLKVNWEREFNKWTDRRVMILSGRNHEAHNFFGAEVIIVNYKLVAASYEEKTRSSMGLPKMVRRFPLVERMIDELGLKQIIIDESHYIKSKKSLRTKALIKLAGEIDRRVCLSGTPIMNRPVELYPQLQALGQFTRTFGTFSRFAMSYCAPKDTPWGIKYDGAANLEDLNERLRSTCMVRRLKKDVLKELPPKQQSLVPLEMDKRISKDYDKAHYDVVEYLVQFDEARADAATRARMLVRMETLKQLAVRAKMKQVIAWVLEFLETGEKLVLFGTHTEFIKEIVEQVNYPTNGGMKNRAMMIIGDTNQNDRNKAVDMFQDPRGVCRLLVCNIKAGGVGLTLTAASNVAFFELPWTPAELDQAEDRTHRIGQHGAVMSWYLLAVDSIEEKIMELINKKRRVVTTAMDGKPITVTNSSVAGDLMKEMRRAHRELNPKKRMSVKRP